MAEKNGYVLCIKVLGTLEKRCADPVVQCKSKKVVEKIKKLEAITMARSASKAEEDSVKLMIMRLREKVRETSVCIPEHMNNPQGMDWHIEYVGNIIVSGNDMLDLVSESQIHGERKYEKTSVKTMLVRLGE